MLATLRSEKALDDLLKLYELPHLRKPIMLAFKRIGEDKFFPFILASHFIDHNIHALKIVQKIGEPILPYLLRLLTKPSVYPQQDVLSLIVSMGTQTIQVELHVYRKKLPGVDHFLNQHGI